MSKAKAKALRKEAERHDITMREMPSGLYGVQVRFTGDHWHRGLASAALALLGEIPSKKGF